MNKPCIVNKIIKTCNFLFEWRFYGDRQAMTFCPSVANSLTYAIMLSIFFAYVIVNYERIH